PQSFTDRVRRRPDHPAITCGDGDLSYRQLDDLAAGFAAGLRSRGVLPGSRVLLRLPRGAAFVAALLAAWRVGATAVPVDPEVPEDRVAEIAADSGAVLRIDAAFAPEPTEVPAADLVPGPGDLAYVIYTSGSTGRPKGVMVSHGALAAHCRALAAAIGLTADDRLAFTASPGFDVAMEQVCVAVTLGATLCPVVQALPTMEEISALLAAHAVTVLNVTPSVWEALGATWAARPRLAATTVRVLLLGAERLAARHIELARTVLPDAAIFNAYGPTETVVTATLHRVAGVDDEGVIGRPVPGRAVYVLDSAGRLAPWSARGQLAFAGPCVADGYLGRPDLTAQRFVPDPFAAAGTGTMVLTGDFGWLRPDGAVVFGGRQDRQVKIRGQRVELEEVERRCLELTELSDVAAVLVDSGQGSELAVFAVRREVTAVPVDAAARELRDELARVLPRYMVPHHVQFLDLLPRTGNGKVDYAALRRIRVEAAVTVVTDPPRGELEERIAAVWSHAIGRTGIGRDDDFFALGGQSLSAVQVIGQLRQELADALTVSDLFRHSTVRRLAEVVGKMVAPTTDPNQLYAAERPDTYEYELSHAQRRLWFINEFVTDTTSYGVPTMLRVDRQVSPDVVAGVWTTLVSRHEALRSTFTVRGSEPVAVVRPAGSTDVGFVDLRAADPDAEAALGAAVDREQDRPFDLEHGPLWRLTVFWLPDGTSCVLIHMHHIITDLWSTATLVREFVATHAGAPDSGVAPVAAGPATYRYSDFAEWERRNATSGRWHEHERYLLGELDPPPEPLELPTDRPRGPVQRYAGDELYFHLDEALTGRVNAYAQERRMTPYMVLLSAYVIALRWLTQADDIVVGMPVANRIRAELSDVVGYFVSTSFVRVDFGAASTVEELVAQVREKCVKAYEYQDYPFDLLVSKARLDRTVDRPPVFSTMLAFQDLDIAPPSATAGTPVWSIEEIKPRTSKFDLGVTVWPEGGRLGYSIAYATDLFDERTVTSIARLFEDCLTRIMEHA
ncbi:MAG: amino acid adenylation domain-containing protein, partial [Actinocatenispora sp.]